MKEVLIDRYGRVTEIVYQILQNTLKISPPLKNAPAREVHAHLLELVTCMSRIEAVRSMPEVKGTKRLNQTIHERGFHVIFQQCEDKCSDSVDYA